MGALKISEKQIQDLIAYIKSEECTDEKRTEIAQVLGIDSQKLLAPDITLLYNFRKLLCTSSDAKELASYLCTGKSTVHQKSKFALLLSVPETTVHDHGAFVEHVLADLFPGKTAEEIQDLSTYFRMKKPDLSSKEKVKNLLGHTVRDLSKPQKILADILTKKLVTVQEQSTESSESV